MRLGVQVMSACLVDVSVAGRVAIAPKRMPSQHQISNTSIFNTRNITLPEDGPEGPKHVGVTTNFKQSDMF